MKIPFIDRLLGFFRIGAKTAPVAMPASVSGFRVIATSARTAIYGCGHQASVDCKIDIHGDMFPFDPDEEGVRAKCPACLLGPALEHTIRCARCGHFIPPGGTVILHPRRTEEPEYAMIYGKRVIGCTRSGCRPMETGFLGFWMGDRLDLLFEGHTHVPRRNSEILAPIAENPQ